MTTVKICWRCNHSINDLFFKETFIETKIFIKQTSHISKLVFWIVQKRAYIRSNIFKYICLYCVCVCVWERDRERERESMCVCVCWHIDAWINSLFSKHKIILGWRAERCTDYKLNLGRMYLCLSLWKLCLSSMTKSAQIVGGLIFMVDMLSPPEFEVK